VRKTFRCIIIKVMKIKKPIKYFIEDVTKGRIDHLIEHRIPWLLLGLFGGIVSTVIISRYEAILSSDIRIAFFITIIVYLSDAVGSQTEAIYIRALSSGKKINFKRYILRESIIGFGLGLLSGIIMALFSAYWLQSLSIGLVVGLAMVINLTIAPILAIIIPNLIYRKHADPALGAGPIATILQDLISLLVYFLIASLIIF